MLSSTESTKTSLEAIRRGEAGLNLHRQSLLDRVPDTGDWASFKRNTITNKDIAYLSASTGHEFALLRGKKRDILFHGDEMHCNINDELLELLKSGKLRLVAHTHSDYDRIQPSADDREFLKTIGQKSSIIISYVTGLEKKFSTNPFEDL